jgi:hypothetical protein
MAWQLSPQSQPVSADFRFPETRHSLSNRFSTRAGPMADWPVSGAGLGILPFAPIILSWRLPTNYGHSL